MQKSLTELLRASLGTLGGRLIAAILGLLVSLIIGRVYGSTMIGFLGIVNSIVLLASIPARMGFGVSVMRFIPEYKLNQPEGAALQLFNKIIFAVLLSSIFTACMINVFEDYWRDLFQQKFDTSIISIVLSLAIVSNVILTVCTAAMRAFKYNFLFILFQFLPALLNLLCLLVLMQVFTNLAPVYAFVIAILTCSILAVTFVNFRESRILRNDSCHDIRLTKLIAISLPMMATGIAAVFGSQYGVIYLGSVGSLAEVGLYVTGLRFATMTGMGLKALNSVAGPQISGLYFSGRTDEMFLIARFISAISGLVALMACLFFVLFGETMIVLLFGADFEGSYPILMVLMVSQFINSATGPTGLILNMSGHQKKCTLITFLASCSFVIASFLLVPEFGAIGLALGVVVFESVWGALCLLVIHREFKQLPICRPADIRHIYNKYKPSWF